MTKGGTECLPTINYGDYCICAVSGVSKATLLLVSLISHTLSFFIPTLPTFYLYLVGRFQLSLVLRKKVLGLVWRGSLWLRLYSRSQSFFELLVHSLRREKQLLVVPNRLFIETMKSPTPLWHADSHLCIKSTRECQL